MFRRAYRPRVLISMFLLSLTAFAQQSAPMNPPTTADGDKQANAARQSAMNMLEEVLAGMGALALPQNRLAIELQAFPVIATRSQPRARALVQQMTGEFSQAASESDPTREFRLPQLRQQRTEMTNTMAQTDPEMALQFLNATRPYVQSTSPKDEDPDDSDLIVGLAAQIASHDPHRALQIAEQQLQSGTDLSSSLVDLLEQVQRSDPQTGTRFFHELVHRVRHADLVSEVQNLSFASSLLANQFTRQSETGGFPDDALLSLAVAVSTAVASPQLQQNQNWAFADACPALKAVVPSRFAALRLMDPAEPVIASAEEKARQDFNDAQSNGDADNVARLIQQAPEDQRYSMAQQAALQFANGGDVERTRQFAANLNPWQSNNAVQDALRNAAAAAGRKGDLATARQLAAQIIDEDIRAILLSQLALQANHAGKPSTAEEILGEATSLVLSHAAGASAFSAQLAVAQAYLRVKPAQAIPLLERSASQLGQALSAAAQLDGFLPDPHSFEGSELVLDRGYLYQSLIQPYAVATADLATIDLATARTLADRIPLPEARLMTELFVARGVLDEDKKGKVQVADRQVRNNRYKFWLEERF